MGNDQGSSTTADATPLPPRATTLLDGVDKVARAQLQPLLEQAFRDGTEHLFQLAERSASNNDQQSLLDSQRQVRGALDRLVTTALTAAGDLSHFGSAPTARHATTGSVHLELLGEQAQEENVVVDDLAARLESRATMQLFELGHRFAVLGGLPTLEADQQPWGPRALCLALQQAIDTLAIPSAHRVELYRAFERLATPRAIPFYTALNEYLATAGILPNLRTFAPRSARKAASKPGKRDAAGTEATPKPEAAAPAATQPVRPRDDALPSMSATPIDTTGSAPDETDSGQIFAALTELLAQRRRQLGPGIAPATSHEPTAADLQGALAALQTRAATVRASGGGTRPRNMLDLRRDMLAQLRQMNPDAATPRLAPGQLDTVELMSMLFDRLVDDLHSASGSQLLSDVQAPMLRAALADKAFFTEPQHPARRWLNTLAEVSQRWGGEGEDADAALVERMRAMTRSVNQNFNGDVGIFEPLIEDLQQQSDTLARKADLTERRHVEAAKGRERLELARLRAEEIIGARLRVHYDATPSLTRNLLQHAWSDVLALTLLRDGEDSPAFKRNLEIADQLTGDPTAAPLPEARKEEARHDIEQGLARIGMPAREAELLAGEAIGEPETDATGQPVTRTELALKLKQRKRLGSASDAEAASFATPPMSAAEQQAFQELQGLPFGTWLECDSDPPGTVVRRKLAWYSPRTGNCLLVNRRGVRSDTTKLEQLARQFAAGHVRLPPPDKGSLVDRALAGILTKLKALTGLNDIAAGVNA